MKLKKQIEIVEYLLKGVKELNSEFQDGWEVDIIKGEQLLEYLKQQDK